MKMEGTKKLFEDFPDISTANWKEKILSDLKGADYHKKLIWKSDEGIHVQPFYRQENQVSLDYLEHMGVLKKTGNAPNGWTICQDIFPEKELKEANKRIKVALKGGAQAIRIHLNDLPLLTLERLDSLLEGVPMGEAELIMKGYLGADAMYDQLTELATRRGVDHANLTGALGADPIGMMATSGIPIASLENIGNLVSKVRDNSPGMRVIDVDGALIHNAGSTLVEELAFALAMASDYLAILTSRGIDPQDVLQAMQLSLAAGPNYFMEVAKLRAARILFNSLVEAYGVKPDQGVITIHTTSSQWNMTLYDPYVNMLRGTTEAMSSILGGADLVSVLPFDHPYAKRSLFSDRIARNVQIILREEAYFDQVSDPASGSYYIENLTDSIGEVAWDLFREVETLGGFRKAFEMGWIQEKISASRDRKMERSASGRGHILGTNAFPDFNEMIAETLANSNVKEDSYSSPLTPLKPFRIASMFEEVRMETEKSEKRPRVLLFKYGNPAWMTARATFSGNLFACAGYEILDQPAFESIEEGIKTAKDQKAEIIVLCSSDDAYSDLAPKVFQELKEVSEIVVAGYPTDALEALRKAGLEHFIHMKCNLLETLKHFNKILL